MPKAMFSEISCDHSLSHRVHALSHIIIYILRSSLELWDSEQSHVLWDILGSMLELCSCPKPCILTYHDHRLSYGICALSNVLGCTLGSSLELRSSCHKLCFLRYLGSLLELQRSCPEQCSIRNLRIIAGAMEFMPWAILLIESMLLCWERPITYGETKNTMKSFL